MKKRMLCLILLLAQMLSSLAFAEGDPIRIAVIDSGISPYAVSPSSLEEGRNYIFPEESTMDKVGHGTGVASIIVGSQSAGISGICPEAVLVPLVFLTEDKYGYKATGEPDELAAVIRDAIDVYHCDIINISSGSAAGSQRLEEAVEYAEKKGVLVVSCAGNGQNKNPGAISYPGGYDSVICVGACSSDGTIASFSQQNDTVDLLALGTDLRLASMKGTRIRGEGTSFATAIVTGAAAQLWTEHPDWSMAQVRDALLKSHRMVDGWAVFDLETALSVSTTTLTPTPKPSAIGHGTRGKF